MEMKNAAKLVNDQIKKLKAEVGQWHVKREDVFREVRDVWQAEYNKKVEKLKATTNTKSIVAILTEFESYHNKTVDKYTSKIVNLNEEYLLNVKSLSKGLGELATPYLRTVKENSYGSGVKAQTTIKKELNQWIKDECIVEYNQDSVIEKLDKKVNAIFKLFIKDISYEENLVKYMAQIDFFTTTMLTVILDGIPKPKEVSKLMNGNSIIESLREEAESAQTMEKIDKALDVVKNVLITPYLFNNELNTLMTSYGKSPDEDSFKRAKLAMKGVRESLSYFKRDFEENLMENYNDMSNMYLNDAKDHLTLGKSCLINDSIAMNENYSMDTASRELISDSLYNYLQSEDFQGEIYSQKKEKKKVKIK